MYICAGVSFWDRPSPPQVRHAGWTLWPSGGSTGGGEEEKEDEEEDEEDEEEEDLSFCLPASGRMNSMPALLGDIWACSPLSGGASSTDCLDKGGSIGAAGGEGVGRKEMLVVMVDCGGGRRVGGGDVSGGLFLLEGKTC